MSVIRPAGASPFRAIRNGAVLEHFRLEHAYAIGAYQNRTREVLCGVVSLCGCEACLRAEVCFQMLEILGHHGECVVRVRLETRDRRDTPGAVS